MKATKNRHENYEILNLIGYGLAKFDNDFIKEFGFSTKSAFYNYCIKNGLASTVGTIKNRMDLFDHFFPNKRKGWWQKGEAYKHRKTNIDLLFGKENVSGYANVVKVYLQENFSIKTINIKDMPIIKSRFKKMQETGLEAEMYFLNNYQTVEFFKGGIIEDARLYGDGYDFQVNVSKSYLLVEVKGIREAQGTLRFTENEFNKASEYKNDYVLSVVLNLNNLPILKAIRNPVKNLKFRQVTKSSKPTVEYQLTSQIK